MDRISLFKKGLAIAVIFLFMEMSVFNSIGTIDTKKIMPSSSGNILYVGGSGPAIIKSFDSPGRFPEGLAWDGKYLWNADADTSAIYMLDPSDGRVIYSFNPSYTGSGIPMGLTWYDTLWNVHRETIYKLDLSGNVIDNISAPGPQPMGLAWDGNYLWCSGREDNEIYKLDRSGSVIYSFDSPGDCPSGLAWDGTYLWNADFKTDTIYKLDPSDGNVIYSFKSPYTAPSGLAWDGYYLWSADVHSSKIYQIDVGDGNQPPDTPIIYGPINGKAGTTYYYNFIINDIDNDSMYLQIDWDTVIPGSIYGPYESGIVILGHTWFKQGDYIISAKAKDVYGAESKWGKLEITMAKNQQSQWSTRLNLIPKLLILGR